MSKAIVNSANELLGVGSGSWVSNRLLTHGFKASSLRTNALLRKDEWVQYDQVIIEVARERLNAVADLISAGLTYQLDSALGVTSVEWETQSDMTAAEQSMDGLTRSEFGRVNFTLNSIPVYITHKDFQLSLRHLEASRRNGQPLDTTQAAMAARLVADKLENAIVNGPGITVAGKTAYGYLNHPNINSYTYAGAEAWDVVGKTGEEILLDVLKMVEALHGDNMFGPYMLYVPKLYWIKLMNDFKTNSDISIIARLKTIPGLNDIKVLDTLPANTTLLVQMTRDVVDLVIGEQPTLVQWETEGGFLAHFKVMAVMVPRVKADYDGRSGICKGTPS